ncbi:hypothetical protein [Kordiimonas marina]|uniref:hypothetical protein n=1 Tax=Kordiimonas marina TaxID=2872312 RepID=UPI001FF12CC2|nr:hypothetical protein [Kordiimonas marina]MCJ9430438.1 hypothetical protein [Kordiimonas marina]
MTEKPSSDHTAAQDKADKAHDAAEESGGIVIEASWAPKDPRDRLYDSTATSREKTVSLVRIFASFHPVLNSIVLTNDMVRRLGAKKSLLILTILVLVGAGLWWRLT